MEARMPKRKEREDGSAMERLEIISGREKKGEVESKSKWADKDSKIQGYKDQVN